MKKSFLIVALVAVPMLGHSQENSINEFDACSLNVLIDGKIVESTPFQLVQAINTAMVYVADGKRGSGQIMHANGQNGFIRGEDSIIYKRALRDYEVQVKKLQPMVAAELANFESLRESRLSSINQRKSWLEDLDLSDSFKEKLQKEIESSQAELSELKFSSSYSLKRPNPRDFDFQGYWLAEIGIDATTRRSNFFGPNETRKFQSFNIHSEKEMFDWQTNTQGHFLKGFSPLDYEFYAKKDENSESTSPQADTLKEMIISCSSNI